MTEQEKREKAIDEMERDVEEALTVPICDDSGATYGYRKTTSVPVIAARLISKGYRKEEEVRKETLQRLFKVIKESGQLMDYSEFAGEGPYWAIDLDDLEDIIRQEFGVEVEDKK